MVGVVSKSDELVMRNSLVSRVSASADTGADATIVAAIEYPMCLASFMISTTRTPPIGKFCPAQGPLSKKNTNKIKYVHV
jgi:hypothetical protein